jgi:O-antigen/teichoic acid export membrane protein
VIPAIAIAGGMKLPGVVLWMAFARLGFTLAHGYYCLRVLPSLKLRPALHLSAILPLLSFGGWVTVSNAINPILLSMDRFLIGAVLSVAMVGYYTAPMEAITKLWMVPTSLMTTVYPACSALGINRIRELQSIYSRSIKYIFCALAPVSLCLVVFARPIISAWLGHTFADKSAVPLQFLAVGVFVNCFAHVPYSFLQALGKPDAAAKLFLCELLPFGLLAWGMTKRFGISGAAAAWSIRVTIEVLLLLWLARRLVCVSFWHALDRRMATGFGALCLFGAGVYATEFFLHGKPGLLAAVCAVWLAVFGLIAWKQVLDDADRASALAVLRPLRNSFEECLESAAAD